MTVYCAGSTADGGIGCTIAGWTTDATNFITVTGDTSAPDGDGRYTGDGLWSTSHYRQETTSNTFTALYVNQEYTVIDGIQVDLSTANTTATNRRSIGINQYSVTIKNCRVRGSKGLGISKLDGVAASYDVYIHNNIVSDTQYSGIYLGSDNVNSHTMNCYNNLVVNAGITGNYGITTSNGGEDYSDDIYNIYNNVVIDMGAGSTADYDLVMTNATVNAHYNSGEGASPPSGHDSNWVQVTPSTDFENYTSYADMRPNDGGALDNGGTTPYASTDINGDTYVTNDIGPLIAVVDAAGGEVFIDHKVNEISQGMRAQTAASMGGVLVQ